MQRLLVCVLLANRLKTGDEGRDLYKQPASDHLFDESENELINSIKVKLKNLI